MEIKEILEKKRQIQKIILDFIDNEGDNEENYQKLILAVKNQNIRINKNELKSFFYLITKISNNHNRNVGFFDKIKHILILFKNEMKTFFTNSELFSIFKRNKIILLFLIKEEIITIDQFIVNILTNDKYSELGYPVYFYNEIKKFIDDELREKLQKLIKCDENLFEENRKIGENEDNAYQLIRNDLIDEFITYVNLNSLPLSMKIDISIYETNNLILKNKPSLIEYAAFFGSIQIFKYLFMNKVKLTPSLWIYAIHGRNPEMIHLLEEKKINPEDTTYFNCFSESIKCHHNEIANYLLSNIIDPKNIKSNVYDLFSSSVKSYNFAYIPNELNNTLAFYDLCQYDYVKLVELLFLTKDVIVNSKIVYKVKFLYEILHYIISK